VAELPAPGRPLPRLRPWAARPGRPVGVVRAYLLLVAMWTRAAAQYPTSLLMQGVAQLAVTGMDFAVVVIVFSHTRSLAGFALPEVMFLYGASTTSLALADLVVGNIERLGRHVRAGTFDVMLVRPVSTLAQLAAEEFSPRRLGKLGTALAVLAVAVARLHVEWTAGRALMVPVMVGCGTLIFAAVWTIVTAVQFVAVEAVELVNTLVYGGGFLAQYPLALYGRQAVLTLTFAVPLAFVNWHPALYVLDRPDPFGLPGAFRFASPAVAAALVLLATAAWRTGLRHYRSTGS
jgi:ABC-2 type transport system permease protein